jgi:tetratricopeptide (TPR) repeat protein
MKNSLKIYQMKRSVPNDGSPFYLTGISAITGILFIALIVIGCDSCTNKNRSGNLIESAVLKQDWQSVLDECRKADSLLQKPETAALMGHAGIMLNRNNESYILLNYISTDSTRRTGWLKWANEFQKQFPRQAIAYYLLGDAFMRNGEKGKAFECLNKSIDIEPEFALALNARGSIYTIDLDKVHALKDLNSACYADSTISEFFVSRAVMFYSGKAPESALRDFNKALRINPINALALNGKACSSFFNITTNETMGNELDTVSFYLYNAYTLLNLPFINENVRSIVLEVENSMFPEENETPFFRGTDFLDWNSLMQRSRHDKYDLFKEILKGPLSDKISVQFLIKLNSLLSRKNLFESYLKNINAPDTIKSIIAMATKMAIVSETSNEKRTACQNRLVFENVYKGLISHYRKRLPGTNIKYNFAQYTVNKFEETSDLQYLQDRQTWNNNVWKPAWEAVKYTGSVVSAAGHPEFGLAITGIGYVGADYTTHDIDRTNQNLAKFNPGGAITDIRRLYLDNDKSYFLICINGIGYDSK